MLCALASSALVACHAGGYRGVTAAEVDLSRHMFQTVSVPPGADGTARYDLLVGVTEVTQSQWREVMGTEPGFARCDNCPVEMVSWYMAATYANALSEREGLTACYVLEGCTETAPYRRGAPGNRFSHEAGPACEVVASLAPTCDGYRLPSRSEWSAYGGVAALSESRRDAHRYAAIANNNRRMTSQVASRLPNEHGLYDTLGNVEEWLDDRTEAPERVSESRQHVALRTWFLAAGTCFRTSLRELDAHHFHSELGSWVHDCVGFRLVRTAPRGSAS